MHAGPTRGKIVGVKIAIFFVDTLLAFCACKRLAALIRNTQQDFPDSFRQVEFRELLLHDHLPAARRTTATTPRPNRFFRLADVPTFELDQADRAPGCSSAIRIVKLRSEMMEHSMFIQPPC